MCANIYPLVENMFVALEGVDMTVILCGGSDTYFLICHSHLTHRYYTQRNKVPTNVCLLGNNMFDTVVWVYRTVIFCGDGDTTFVIFYFNLTHRYFTNVTECLLICVH